MIRGFFIGCIVMILLLCGLLIHTHERLDQVSDAYALKAKEVQVWRDLQGRSNAELEVTKLQLKDAKRVEKQLLDSVNKAIGVKPKHVKSVVTISTHTTDTIPFYIKMPRYTDKWSHFEWVDSSKLVYKIYDSLMLVNHTKKYGFLKLREKYVTRVITFNPNTVLTGMRSLEITPSRRRLSLGAHAGYGVQVSGSRISAGWNLGVGLGWRIL